MRTCPCGYTVHGGDPWSAEWHRGHRDHHLLTYPDVDQGTRDSLEQLIALAERRELRDGKPPAWLVVGATVDYCSIIGEPPTEHGLIVRAGPQRMASGHWVVWLRGKAGCVAVEACQRPTPPGPDQSSPASRAA